MQFELSQDNLFLKAKRSIIWIASSSVIFQVINWIITVIAMRILLPDDYGLMAVLLVVTDYLVMLGHLNIASWFVWKDDISELEESTVTLSIYFFSIMVFMLAFIIAPFFADFFHKPDLIAGFRIISFTIIFTGFSRPSEMKFERELNFKPIAIINVTTRLIQGCITITLAFLQFHYLSLLYSLFLTKMIRAAILIYLKPPVLKKAFDFNIFKEGLRFGLNITLGTLFWIIYTSSDQVIIGRYFAPEVIGFYAIAMYFIDIPLAKLNETIRPVLHPYFSRLRATPEALNKIILKFNFLFMAALLPIFIGLSLLSKDFVYAILGSKWAGAIFFLKILAFVGILRTLTNLIAPYLIGIGKPELDKRYNAIGMIAMPISFFFLTKYMGINGIVYAWLFLYPVIPILMIIFFVRCSGVSLKAFFKNIISPVTASLIMGAILILSNKLFIEHTPTLFLLVLKVTLGSITYILVFYIFFLEKIRESLRLFQN